MMIEAESSLDLPKECLSVMKHNMDEFRTVLPRPSSSCKHGPTVGSNHHAGPDRVRPEEYISRRMNFVLTSVQGL